MESPRTWNRAASFYEPPLLSKHIVLIQIVELALLFIDAAENKDAAADHSRCVSIPSLRSVADCLLLEVPVITHYCKLIATEAEL